MPVPDRQRLLSNALLGVGIVATFAGLATAIGGVGLTILFFVPLPFTGASLLVRSRWRVAAALFVWGCWFFAAYLIVT